MLRINTKSRININQENDINKRRGFEASLLIDRRRVSIKRRSFEVRVLINAGGVGAFLTGFTVH